MKKATAIIIAALLLTACSKDTEEVKGIRASFEVQAGVPWFVEAKHIDGSTRSWALPTGYYSYEDINNQFEGHKSMENTSIETFFTKDGEAPQQGTLFYDRWSSKWKLSLDIKQTGNYNIYGFLPKDEATSSSVEANSSYSNGAVMTLSGLSTVTPSDICFIVGAKDGTTDDTVDGLQTGQFVVNAKETNGSNSNYIFLLFDHLYAAMRLRYTIDTSYDALRTVNLRKIELQALPDNDGIPVKAKQNAVVTLQSNNTGDSPVVGSVVFTPDNSSADSELEPLYEGEVTLNTSVPVNFMGSFIPGSTAYFKVRTTYDVYDKKGNLLREGSTAENIISLRDIFETTTIERGHMFSITFTVQPTYYYVLSGYDLNTPTMVIN
jgi:hypothetical protein